MNSKKLIIFSKAPIPGQVKTRLIPALGEIKATQLHKYMLTQTVEMSTHLKDIDCELHCAPNTEHDFFRQLTTQYGIRRQPQHGSHLGEKMAYAMNTALQTHSQCIIIGTDCPHIDTQYIQQGFDQLLDSDVVLGPATDGGYVLIGSKAFDYQLFNDIDWSTSKVLQQTLKNINHLQWKYHKLDTLSDVDTHDDLAHLSSQYLDNAFS